MKEQDNLKRIRICSEGEVSRANWHFMCDGKELNTISKDIIAGRHPIQIVEDRGATFIVLLKHIDFEKKYYKTIPSLSMRKNGSWALVLYNFFKSKYKDDAFFAPHDVIRNPTISELNLIKETFKKCGLCFNRKTNKVVLVDKEKYKIARNTL
jgi:hypothetical protein